MQRYLDIDDDVSDQSLMHQTYVVCWEFSRVGLHVYATTNLIYLYSTCLSLPVFLTYCQPERLYKHPVVPPHDAR